MIHSTSNGAVIISSKPPSAKKVKRLHSRQRARNSSERENQKEVAYEQQHSVPEFSNRLANKMPAVIVSMKNPALTGQFLFPQTPKRNPWHFDFLCSSDSKVMSMDEIKDFHVHLIEKEQEYIKRLKRQCEISIKLSLKLESTLSSKEKDIKLVFFNLNRFIDTLKEHSERDAELIQVTRQLKKQTTEYKHLKFQYDNLLQRYHNSEMSSKDQRLRLKQVQGESIKQSKTLMTERHKYSRKGYLEISAKIQVLEEGISSVQARPYISGDSSKLKAAITALIRELQDLKREIRYLKAEKSNYIEKLEKEHLKIAKMSIIIFKLKNKSLKLDDFDEDGDIVDYTIRGYRNMFEPRTLQHRVSGFSSEHQQLIHNLLAFGPDYLKETDLDADWIVMLHPILKTLFEINLLVEKLPELRQGIVTCFTRTDVYSLISNVSGLLEKLLEAERAFYWVFDSGNMTIWTSVEGKDYEFSADNGLYSIIIREKLPCINSANPQNNEGYSDVVENALNYTAESLLLYPVFNNDKNIIGFVELVNSKTKEFNYDDEHLIELIMPVISHVFSKLNRSYSSILENKVKEQLLRWLIDISHISSLEVFLDVTEQWIKNTFSIGLCRVILCKEDNFHFLVKSDITVLKNNIGISGSVFLNKERETVSSPYKNIRYNQLIDLSTSFAVSYIPIIDQANCLFIIQLAHQSQDSSRFTENPHIDLFCELFTAYSKFFEGILLP